MRAIAFGGGPSLSAYHRPVVHTEWPPSAGRLDQLRLVGDPPADDLVGAIFDAGPAAIDQLQRGLFQYEASEDALPGEAASFMAEPVEGIEVKIGKGQALFQELGPEVLLILGCYSLPAAYAATKGARVLAQTGFLTEDTDRRLGETSQMVVDVMTAGGLEPGGTGIWAARKVRLMHAAIRHLILGRIDVSWDTEHDGVPVNQEDMAATLMTFSYLVVTGLRRLGFWVSREEAEEYLAAWKVVGGLMGVLPELIPADFDEAARLTETIEGRQIAPGEVGWSRSSAPHRSGRQDRPGGARRAHASDAPPSCLRRAWGPPEQGA